ncbi:hypothetical protein PR002_g5831 [Phytophthora rubi]|uniref:Uncharacterized protein n=1 Tax=Phytophthora rubi TaxID=129364 RepID=A0A6A3NC10_9STRA|nr:hypothetical protein PR002_g5831 [Phytophthora rubi]
MPERIRRLIPRDRDVREPCLRFMGGGIRYGGSAERCAHQKRTHRLGRPLPTRAPGIHRSHLPVWPTPVRGS